MVHVRLVGPEDFEKQEIQGIDSWGTVVVKEPPEIKSEGVRKALDVAWGRDVAVEGPGVPILQLVSKRAVSVGIEGGYFGDDLGETVREQVRERVAGRIREIESYLDHFFEVLPTAGALGVQRVLDNGPLEEHD